MVLGVRLASLAVLVLGLAAAPIEAEADAGINDERPVRDIYLKKRLTEKKVYTTEGGQTLQSLARLLYGHSSWWHYLKRDNPRLAAYGSDRELPIGTRVAYLGPKIGRHYVVQPNDWLVRIAIWKYGSSDSWQELYRANAKAIRKPDLIYPGDELEFSDDGTVKLAKVSRAEPARPQVLVQGLAGSGMAPSSGEENPPAFAPPPPRETSAWEKIADGVRFVWEMPDRLAGDHEAQTFAVGFGIGLLFFLLTPAAWYLRRKRLLAEGEDPSEFGRPDDFVAAPEGAPHDMNRYPYAFEVRDVEDPRVRRDLLREEEGEVDRRPRYQNLIQGRLKKYLKSLTKKKVRKN